MRTMPKVTRNVVRSNVTSAFAGHKSYSSIKVHVIYPYFIPSPVLWLPFLCSPSSFQTLLFYPNIHFFLSYCRVRKIDVAFMSVVFYGNGFFNPAKTRKKLEIF